MAFQSIPFLVISYQLKEKVSERIINNTFFFLYILLSVLFGWTSGKISNLLGIPLQQDLFVILIGVLIMPLAFIIYFDKTYEHMVI
jgi:hypothetical protein